MPSCSSKPFSSSSAVSSVQAFSRLPSAASGISRRMPLPRPCAVSNLKIASIASGAGARHLARRGAVGIDAEAGRRGAAGVGLQLAAGWRRAPLMVCSVPAQRQHVAPIAVGMKQAFSAGHRRSLRARASNCASQFSTATEISSVLSSMRVSRTGRLRGVFPERNLYPFADRAERRAYLRLLPLAVAFAAFRRSLADHALALLQRPVIAPPQMRRGAAQRPPRLRQRRHLLWRSAAS